MRAASGRPRRTAVTRTSRDLTIGWLVCFAVVTGVWTGLGSVGMTASLPTDRADSETSDPIPRPRTVSQVLDWNQIFVDTLVATNTANSSSQRLGALVYTAAFDGVHGVQ